MIILNLDLQPQFKYMSYFIYTSHQKNYCTFSDSSMATMGDKSVGTLCHIRVLKENFFPNLYNTTLSPLFNVGFPKIERALSK